MTYGTRDPAKMTKPLAGHYEAAGVEPGVRLVEFRLDDVSDYEVGQEISVSTLDAGDLVDVTAVSKGKGWAGVMKRHNFKGQPASHGNHKSHRKPGAIGQCATPARVFKGRRMAGQMGHDRVTIQNLRVEADADNDIVLLHGAVPATAGWSSFVTR